MVGIVLVSHSPALAAGVMELAEQMAHGRLRMAVAAGSGDSENPLGTNPVSIQAAIESVDDPDGVLVLMDLGSAVLSSETALELLTLELRERVRLCEAPLVEGALAAAVQAAAGSGIEQVLAEAKGALGSKAQQLTAHITIGKPSTPPPPPAVKSAAARAVVAVPNALGLHARPAAKFVAAAARFQSRVNVRNATRDTAPINAKSINQVATLGARQGHTLEISGEGVDSREAVAALQSMVAAGFGESDAPATASDDSPVPAGEFAGQPASPGIAIGPVLIYHPAEPHVADRAAEAPETEWQMLERALSEARNEILILRNQTASQSGDEEAAIFDAHRLCLEDPSLLDKVRERIFQSNETAPAAWKAVVDATTATFRAMDDAYLRARAADILDVGRRVLQILSGAPTAPLEVCEPAIVVATVLTPSDVAGFDPARVLGICTAMGSPQSHAAILARSLDIPAVARAGLNVLNWPPGTLVALDGSSGRIWLKPDAVTLADLHAQRDKTLAANRVLRENAHHAVATRDGRAVRVLANLQGAAGTALNSQTKAALDAGADGVGLLRTEFLFFDRTSAPTEDEQFAAYESVAAQMDGRPLVIRTADIGGDKPLPYVAMGAEPNPFLGWRGIRQSLETPGLLKPQLRAILRASAGRAVKIMFPMVASLGEVRAAKALVAEIQEALKNEGVAFDAAIKLGAMIEVPAAVAIAERLAAEVDFFSIGTNDLSQYVMAADRGNPKVSAMADGFEPAVLRMIGQTVHAAHGAKIPVSVCGEMAGDPLAVPLLLGLGVDELSMNSPSIPAAKSIVERWMLTDAEELAREALKLDSAAEVRALVAKRQN